MADTALDQYLVKREQLVAMACRLVESRAIAEEIVQESWLRWQSQSYSEDSAKPILRRIVRNLALDCYRRQRLENQVLTFYASQQEEAPDSERVVGARQDLLRIVAVLQKLEPRAVTAFRLHRIDGMPYAKIARKLGVSPSTAFKLVEDVLVEIILALQV
ncbi:MAG: sigma-70 family RNA polymerase sigma factor [Pseudomonadota bacterium]